MAEECQEATPDSGHHFDLDTSFRACYPPESGLFYPPGFVADVLTPTMAWRRSVRRQLLTPAAYIKTTKSIPAAVSALFGKKVNKIHVLKFNGKKSKLGKRVVECRFLACRKPFSVNA